MTDDAAAGTATAWAAPRGFAIEMRGAAARWPGPGIGFECDWRGQDADPRRRTEVRLAWTAETLFLRFDCRYRTLTVFPAAAGVAGRRMGLWERAGAEAFLRPEPRRTPPRYGEFEIAPNGLWLDLDIDWERGKVGAGAARELRSGMGSAAWIDRARRRWTAELAIPMQALTREFDPGRPWRANFFRVEGAREPRGYFAWRPTGTPQPQFHVPAAFGRLRFARGGGGGG